MSVRVLKAVFPVPEFLMIIWSIEPGTARAQPAANVPEWVTDVRAVSCELRSVGVAELVNDPKRPNTKPATAMAAMRVIAMRMTVSRSFKR